MANSVELRVECLRNNISLDALAARIGVNSTTLYRKIKGESEFNRNELQIIKDTLALDDERFIDIFFTEELAETQDTTN